MYLPTYCFEVKDHAGSDPLTLSVSVRISPLTSQLGNCEELVDFTSANSVYRESINNPTLWGESLGD